MCSHQSTEIRLRYLTIKIDKFSNEPSIPAQMASRDERQIRTEQKIEGESGPSQDNSDTNPVNEDTKKQETQGAEKGES